MTNPRRPSGYHVTLDGNIIVDTFDWERGAEEWPVTNMIDWEGEETDELELVRVVVFSCGPDEWHSFDIRNCIQVTGSEGMDA